MDFNGMMARHRLLQPNANADSGGGTDDQHEAPTPLNVVCARNAADEGNGWLDLILGGNTGPSQNAPTKLHLHLSVDWIDFVRIAAPVAAAKLTKWLADFNNDGVLTSL